jgi:hypothetical protein
LELIDQIAALRSGQEATILLEIEAPTHLARCDRVKVINLTCHLPEAEQAHLREAGRARAESLLVHHRGILEIVADRLEASGTMDAATLDGIWDGAR